MVTVAHRVNVRTSSGNMVRSVYQDGKGRLYIGWVGCGRGIVRYVETEEYTGWVWDGESFKSPR